MTFDQFMKRVNRRVRMAAPIDEHIYARDLRDVPAEAPIADPQSAYARLKRPIFPDDVELLYDHYRRGWNVGPAAEILMLDGLRKINEKLDRLLKHD